MSLFYVTGISGSGKSEALAELRKRGYEAHGTDEDGVGAFVDRDTGAIVSRPDNPAERTLEWREKTAWNAQRDKVEELAEKAKDKPIFLCGVVENEDEVWDLFSKVFALVIDEDTLRHRITTRTNNNFGQNAHELETILSWQKTAEDYYRDIGAKVVDATQPIIKVVDEIINVAGSSPNP